MPWKKGQSGNPEGRKHGQLNKMTVAMKEAMAVESEISKVRALKRQLENDM